MEVIQTCPAVAKPSNILTSCKHLALTMVTRTHAGHFRIPLSLGWQSLLWKILLHHQHPTLLTILWSFSSVILTLLSCLYLLRCIFFFEKIKEEFSHHVGVNYLFAPWISWLLVLESAPFVAPEHDAFFVVLWWVLAAPVVALDVKIYGQWFTTGRRFLTAAANPSSHLSVVGNLVGARAASKMGWREASVFLFSLGMVHYLVLFVTLYQRLSGGDRLPAVLRPVFFLFFAAPSAASLAWYSISGRFDTGSKMMFFLSLFLFASLVRKEILLLYYTNLILGPTALHKRASLGVHKF